MRQYVVLHSRQGPYGPGALFQVASDDAFASVWPCQAITYQEGPVSPFTVAEARAKETLVCVDVTKASSAYSWPQALRLAAWNLPRGTLPDVTFDEFVDAYEHLE